jgi:hypothetical protein
LHFVGVARHVKAGDRIKININKKDVIIIANKKRKPAAEMTSVKCELSSTQHERRAEMRSLRKVYV